jgi:hypothetical protein
VRVAKALVLKTWQARNDKQVDERLNSAIQRGCEQQAFTRNGNFLWPLGKRVAPLRVHTNGRPARAVDDIAPEEMQLALAECIKNSITIAPEDLAREACRLFGLRATRENLRPFEAISGQMVEDGVLKIENGKLARGDFF